MFLQMERDKHFSSLLYSTCEGLILYCPRRPRRKQPDRRKKPYLSPLLKNGHLRITLELKPRIGKFSLLYANIAPKWNTITSCERQGLETLKALPKV